MGGSTVARELWDAYDREGNRLGFDLIRGEPLPEGVWHLVAEIYSVTTDGRVLVTRRSPEKNWGGFWEVTAGSVLKGETPLRGAVRELWEETGLTAREEDLRPVYAEPRPGIDGYPTIYHCFLYIFDPAEQTIRLQEGETVDWRLMPYGAFQRFVLTDEFVEVVRRRFLKHREAFDRLMAERFG